MSLAQILAILGILKPLLSSLEQNELQPEIQKLIAQVTNPDLKALLTALDQALEAFAQVEIQKL